MWPPERTVPFREFSTPPASWRRPPHSPMTPVPVPMSETRRRFLSPAACGRDDFHAVHKVPPGDSPYAKAKHVQLVDKDPSKAVALFWAAINAGDRVDSALKDMAVVMKQLDRSDEAIEAVKSFRYLCPQDSQESLDHILIDLYKRSGKVEEEIEMHQQMLKNIEEEIAVFGPSRTKIARSQGKKVQITVVQEKARILGNLAWAYLQQHNYGFAEQNYRKAMLLEPDKNKQCNLALCLMHMNQIPEAKSLLEEVRMASGVIEQMDESYAKSYERASEMLSKLELGSQRTKQQDEESLSFPDNLKTQETVKSRSVMSEFGIHPSSQPPCADDWSRGHYFESPVDRSNSVDRWTSTPCSKGNCNTSPAAVLYTQPRLDPRRAIVGSQRREAFGLTAVPRPSDKLLSHTIRNLSGELDSTNGKIEMRQQGSMPGFPLPTQGAWGRSWNQKKNDPATDSWRKPSIAVGDVSAPIQDVATAATKFGASDARFESEQEAKFLTAPAATLKSTDNANENCVQEITSSRCTGKSWADIADEEEQEQLLSAANGRDHDDIDRAFNDENMECNISQMLGRVHLDEGSNSSKTTGSGSKNRAVRRSLSFGDDKDGTVKRTRLQVFQDITPYSESP